MLPIIQKWSEGKLVCGRATRSASLVVDWWGVGKSWIRFPGGPWARWKHSSLRTGRGGPVAGEGGGIVIVWWNCNISNTN